MKYYILETDQHYIAPYPINCDCIRPIYMKTEDDFYKLSKRLMFQVEKHMQMTQTDVITKPNFFISEKMKQVALSFLPNTPMKRILFYGKEQGISMVYYIPLLESIPCFTKNTSFNRDKSVILAAEIEESKVKDKPLFRAVSEHASCIMGRLDFLEVLLQQGAVGIGMKEVSVSKP